VDGPPRPGHAPPPAALTPQALNAALLTSGSATAVLEAVCGAPVTVHRLSPDGPDPAPEPARLLGAHGGEIVLRRHVALLCGGRAVSHAELWYVAARLPPALARRRADTAEPFGRVVAGLGLGRRTLSARLCAAGEPCALEHRAVLADPAGRALALVHERYSWALFGCS
jgi:chorismate-pyruvate lyase